MDNSISGQTREFQAEVRQLLDIVVNSLYTDREIFLRELISNAADAMEKLRYLQVTGQEVEDAGLPLEINIATDNIAHTLTISDTGIGMTEAELVENLGTIAHSGSREFIKRLAAGDQKDFHLIGQFGVGFYSAFMVAKNVTVYTRSYKGDEPGWIWTSEGFGSYNISEGMNLPRGTKIVLKLKDAAQEFAREETVKRIIKQYSSFVPYPILVNGQKANTIQALWTKNKSEISETEYNEFYKFIATAYDDPMFRLHFSSDAPLAINALLFVPKDNLERHGFGRLDPGTSLYCKKVLIQEKAKDILPEWLRFLRGVVDSEELPLNISRETMQDSALIARLRKVITGRFLKFLEEQARTEPEKYKEFWEKFGFFIKEGAASDFTHQDDLVKLLRFESSKGEPGQLVSLKEYVDRMQPEQEFIYYLNGPAREVIEAGPYLEIFQEHNLEVLYTREAVDDYILSLLGQFQGKKTVSADQADLELPPGAGQANGEEALAEAEATALSQWLKEVLGEKVVDVRPSKRLVRTPAIVLSQEGTYSLQRWMQLVKKDFSPQDSGVLEINTRHQVVKRINELRQNGDPFAGIAAEQILINAQISAGLIVDPKGMVERLYQILARALD
ncbi:MAG: molecular chaperone HtpG [Syntrophomonadaceae bacterium]|nr:molecular chaperone HtpG [Syntrophomonadaceae bacterium]